MNGGVHLRKYGVETTIDFSVYEIDGINLRVDWVPAAADCEVMKDEGTSTQCTNTATDEGSTYSVVLTATEMQAARIVLKVVDAATKVFLDITVVIETYGNASAMHAFDLDTASTPQTADHTAKLATMETTLNAAATASALAATDTVCDSIKAITDAIPDSGAMTSIAQQSLLVTIAGYLDTEIAAIKAKTDLIPADPATETTLATIDGVVDAIKVVTDNLPNSGALTSIAQASALATVDALIDGIVAQLAGITLLRQWLGAMAGKQAPDATAQTEMRATGAGSGGFLATTDSQEAIRDRGDAEWITGGGGAGSDVLTVNGALGRDSGGDIIYTLWLENNGVRVDDFITNGVSTVTVTLEGRAGSLGLSGTPTVDDTRGIIHGSGTPGAFTDDDPVMAEVHVVMDDAVEYRGGIPVVAVS